MWCLEFVCQDVCDATEGPKPKSRHSRGAHLDKCKLNQMQRQMLVVVKDHDCVVALR